MLPANENAIHLQWQDVGQALADVHQIAEILADWLIDSKDFLPTDG